MAAAFKGIAIESFSNKMRRHVGEKVIMTNSEARDLQHEILHLLLSNELLYAENEVLKDKLENPPKVDVDLDGGSF